MNRTPLYAVISFVLGGVMLVWASGTDANDSVRLDTGLVSGLPGSSAEIRIFKGIPFAAPSVGNRWRAPQPAAHFGPICMQNPPGRASDQKVSEDCLYLNIWTGAKSAGERRPVNFAANGDPTFHPGLRPIRAIRGF